MIPEQGLHEGIVHVLGESLPKVREMCACLNVYVLGRASRQEFRFATEGGGGPA